MDCFNKFIEQEKLNGKSGWVTYSATDLYNKVKVFSNKPFKLTSTMFGRKIKNMPNVKYSRKSSGIWYDISYDIPYTKENTFDLQELKNKIDIHLTKISCNSDIVKCCAMCGFCNGCSTHDNTDGSHLHPEDTYEIQELKKMIDLLITTYEL